MDASNKLANELVPTYKDFKPYQWPDGTFTGYKLVEKKNLNYYSIVTGLFRYRPKRISENSYHGLYQKTQDKYEEHLKNKLAICCSKEDAKDMLIKYLELYPDREHELVLLEIEIQGDLVSAKASNSQKENVDVVIGHTINKVKEVKSFKAVEL